MAQLYSSGRLYAVMCVRNEAYNLPGFLKHIASYVDGIVALDDGSTDDTVKLLKEHPKVIDVIRRPVQKSHSWDEVGNREKVLRRARAFGGQWVLCCDPDERFEIAFLEQLPALITHKQLYTLHVRELWDSTRQYRCDGVWGKKVKQVLFPLSDTMHYSHAHKLHRPWWYDELKGTDVLIDFNLYHLKMITDAGRIQRRDMYNALDPKREMQSIGYDYMTDLDGLQLEAIPPGKDYDRSTLPLKFKLMSIVGR